MYITFIIFLLSILIAAAAVAAAAAAAAVSVETWILLRRQAKLKEMNRAIGCINPRTWRRRGKGGILTSIDSLPDDLLFNILVRLPAHDIHRNARLVCRRWKLLVHGDAFVGAHLHRTGYGLLFCHSPNYSGLGNYIFGSCNGLVLGTKYSKQDSNHSIYVANPATNQVVDLPRFLVESDFEEGAFNIFCRFGIAYAAASAKYKVVAVYVLSGSDIFFTVECLRYAILTVGVDTAWREIAIDQLSPLAKSILCGFFHILTTEGYLHWVPLNGKHVLTMDVETEKIVETPPPYEYKKNPSNIYLSTGSYLTLLINHDNFMWEVWEMKGGSGEWREVVPDIDLNAHVSELPRLGFDDEDYNLTPIGWVKYPEVLLFIPFDRRYHDKTDSRGLITYNLEGDEINSVKLPVKSKYFDALVHKNSLVWWC